MAQGHKQAAFRLDAATRGGDDVRGRGDGGQELSQVFTSAAVDKFGPPVVKTGPAGQKYKVRLAVVAGPLVTVRNERLFCERGSFLIPPPPHYTGFH